MAIPVFQNFGTTAAGIGDVSPGLPTGIVANDLLLLFVESANEAIAAPAGWTQVPNSHQGTGTAGAAGGVRLAIFSRVATGGESAPVVTDTGDHTAAVIGRFTGVDTTTPIHATAGSVLSAGNTAITCPAVTTTISDCLIVNAIATDRDLAATTTFSDWTNASLSSLAEIFDQTTDTASGGGLGVATGGLAAAGGSGTTTATQATAVTAAMITLAIAPPADTLMPQILM